MKNEAVVINSVGDESPLEIKGVDTAVMQVAGGMEIEVAFSFVCPYCYCGYRIEFTRGEE